MSFLSTFNTTTEGRTLSKAPNPQLLPARRSIGCPLLQVCVCSLLCVCALGWVKCRTQIPSIGHHTTYHIFFLLFFLWIRREIYTVQAQFTLHIISIQICLWILMKWEENKGWNFHTFFVWFPGKISKYLKIICQWGKQNNLVFCLKYDYFAYPIGRLFCLF